MEKAATPTKVHKYITTNGEVRAATVISTDLVREICQAHIASPAASIIMGRAISAAILMAANQKDGYRVGLNFLGDGPLKRIYAESTFEGATRAYPQNPNATFGPETEDFSIGDALGKGILTVETTFSGQKKPYRGSVEIQTGEVGDDVAYYLYQSQQTPSIVSVGVLLDPHGQVIAAGGVLIELMPGHSSDTVIELEGQAVKAKSILESITAGKGPRDLAEIYLAPFDFEEMEHEHTIRHECRCSLQRVISSVDLFPLADLKHMVEVAEPQEVSCEFCKATYLIPVSAIESALSRASAKAAEKKTLK